ncbi:hypothetical protein SK128_001699 [Halocaridina rubra]|uniref:C-type lectin domain-containing protein n=1 Tax=Halocaridina rubra TaxID=373956 RepID=A0AAN9AAN3_HALRR
MWRVALICISLLSCALGEEEEKSVCFPGFQEINGKCYYFSAQGEDISWHGARDTCINYGGDLAAMGKSCVEDITFMQEMISRGISITWVGASDLAIPGTFRWVDGEDVDPYFQSWYPEQPQNDLYSCAYLKKTDLNERMYMHNGLCSNPHSYICEVPLTKKSKKKQEGIKATSSGQ